MVTALTFFRQESLLSAVQVSNQCEDTLIQLCSFIYNMFLLGVLCIQQVFDGKRHGFHPKMEYQVFLCIFQKNSAIAAIGLKGIKIFHLFPIISISKIFFSIFFLTLEKIGIDEKVISYHNISN